MALNCKVVPLATQPMHTLASTVREGIVAKVGEEEHKKRFPDYEWRRLSFAMSRLRSGKKRVLEVGPGRGFLTRMMLKSKRFEEIHAIDIVPRALPKAVNFRELSIDQIDWPDGYFDAVICMEVLEHLPDGVLEAGLAHIRRVCAGQLIMSVPFCEPLPLPHYHVQHFDDERIQSVFPDGKYSLLLKDPITRVPWMVVEENYGA